MAYQRGDQVRLDHPSIRRDARGVVESTGVDGTYTVRVGSRTLRGVRREQLAAEPAPFWAARGPTPSRPGPFWAAPTRSPSTVTLVTAPPPTPPRRGRAAEPDPPPISAGGGFDAMGRWAQSRGRRVASGRRGEQAPPLWG